MVSVHGFTCNYKRPIAFNRLSAHHLSIQSTCIISNQCPGTHYCNTTSRPFSLVVLVPIHSVSLTGIEFALVTSISPKTVRPTAPSETPVIGTPKACSVPRAIAGALDAVVVVDPQCTPSEVGTRPVTWLRGPPLAGRRRGRLEKTRDLLIHAGFAVRRAHGGRKRAFGVAVRGALQCEGRTAAPVASAPRPADWILPGAEVQRRSGVEARIAILGLFPLLSSRPICSAACEVVCPMLHLQSQVLVIHSGEHLLHVVVKGFSYIVHHVEVLDIQDSRLGWLGQSKFRYLICIRHGVVVCEAPCHLEGVADLPPIPLTHTASIAVLELVIRKVKDLGVVNLQRPLLFALLADLAKPLDVELPYVDGLVLGQGRVVDLVVYPRLESLVKSTRPIGSQEKNASVVVQNTQKH